MIGKLCDTCYCVAHNSHGWKEENLNGKNASTAICLMSSQSVLGCLDVIQAGPGIVCTRCGQRSGHWFDCAGTGSLRAKLGLQQWSKSPAVQPQWSSGVDHGCSPAGWSGCSYRPRQFRPNDFSFGQHLLQTDVLGQELIEIVDQRVAICLCRPLCSLQGVHLFEVLSHLVTS